MEPLEIFQDDKNPECRLGERLEGLVPRHPLED
jgi:hypothetical protein